MSGNRLSPKYSGGMRTPIKSLIAILFVTTAGVAIGSGMQAGPNSKSGARAFNFWIGEWNIRQEILQQDGTWLELPAHTSVAAALDGSALIEHWSGQVLFFWEGMTEPRAMKGLSVRAYDPQTGKWYIHWMDTRSPRFGSPYAGNFTDGRGVFFRE